MWLVPGCQQWSVVRNGYLGRRTRSNGCHCWKPENGMQCDGAPPTAVASRPRWPRLARRLRAVGRLRTTHSYVGYVDMVEGTHTSQCHSSDAHQPADPVACGRICGRGM